MGLLIHDLNAEEWDRVKGEYEGWNVIDAGGAEHPCIGCFSCWNKTPGVCAIKDGYENMGELIHRADEVVVISRCAFGGFSGPVKNVFDRCLGYVLPQFEVTGGETHHRRRYEEDKPFTFIFRGSGLSDEEKRIAGRYVEAVCANIRGYVKRLEFAECPEEPARAGDAGAAGEETGPDGGSVVLLNFSMRAPRGNGAVFAGKLSERLNTDIEILNLKAFPGETPELIEELERARAIVLCIPLYVDGLPSQAIRFMERFLGEYKGGSKRVYLLANMGLYESKQLVNLFDAVKLWCARAGLEYSGGLGISAGELLGVLAGKLPFGAWPTRKVAAGMRDLAAAIDGDGSVGDIFAEPNGFPRSLYIWIANTNWNRTARKNDLTPEDLYRRL